MILLREDVVWVRVADGCLQPLDVERLASAIGAAAARCGRLEPWRVEAVAVALQEFVSRRYAGRVVTVRELDWLALQALVAVGCGDVAVAYDGGRRFCREIRLDELVCGGEGGFELEFFRRLDVALRQAVQADVLAVRLRGLRVCVRRLRGTRRWGLGCRRLAEEIVGHVRGRLAALQVRRNVGMQLVIGD